LCKKAGTPFAIACIHVNDLVDIQKRIELHVYTFIIFIYNEKKKKENYIRIQVNNAFRTTEMNLQVSKNIYYTYLLSLSTLSLAFQHMSIINILRDLEIHFYWAERIAYLYPNIIFFFLFFIVNKNNECIYMYIVVSEWALFNAKGMILLLLG
jgi:hypothetical protein